jgi:hypothetical protein
MLDGVAELVVKGLYLLEISDLMGHGIVQQKNIIGAETSRRPSS